MTKKTLTVYGILFLCAFAFGLSFTMASSAQAEYVPICCVVQWCAGYEGTHVEIMGHGVYHGPSIGVTCDYDPPDDCDAYNQCPPIS